MPMHMSQSTQLLQSLSMSPVSRTPMSHTSPLPHAPMVASTSESLLHAAVSGRVSG
jgi:hypothetical protein